MIEIHNWPANSIELIEAGQWLQLTYISIWNGQNTCSLRSLNLLIFLNENQADVSACVNPALHYSSSLLTNFNYHF